MTAANIEINGTATSKDALAINVLVQLSNADTGGEVSYLWEVLDQPEGTADALSNPNIENPTFTPKKEGSYLIRLTVNKTLPSEVANTKIAAIRQLKTNERIAAAGEVFEVDLAAGWKTAINRLLNRCDDVVGDANLVVVVLPGASVPALSDVVQFDSTSLIKSGLPGVERLSLVHRVAATTLTDVNRPLGVVVGTPTGAAPAANGLAIVRINGLVELTAAGAPAVGAYVYVNDAGVPSLTPGTISRSIGRVVDSPGGGVYRWAVHGLNYGEQALVQRTTTVAAVSAWTSTGGWGANIAGYVLSSGPGTLFVPIAMAELDRLKGVVFARFGDASADFTANLRKLTAAGALSTIATITVNDSPASWNDTTLGTVASQLAAGDSHYLEITGTAPNLRIGTVRWTWDRPGQ